MPALTNIPNTTPDEQTRLIAQRIPLVHVTDRGSMRLDQIVELIRLGEIPSSAEENGYCGSHARFVEDQLGIPRCVYFYAGRACPDYGRVALSFLPDIETGVFLSASPFDTGGMIRDQQDETQGFHLNLQSDNLDSRIQYCRGSLVTSPQNWRVEFARWFSVYFQNATEAYWNGIPNRIDPEELYAPSKGNAWQAWTWEIRLSRGPNPTQAEVWSCDIGYLNDLDERVSMSGLNNDELERIANFRERTITPEGSPYFCEDIELWIRRMCLSTS